MKVLTIAIASLLACSAYAGAGCADKDKSTVAAAKASVVSPGKRVAAIDIGHRLSAKPAVGKPLQLELVVDSRTATEFDLAVKLPPAVSGDALQYDRRVAAGEAVTLELVPLAEGRHYVSVIASPVGRGGAPRVISVPIEVGTVAALKAAAPQRAADGELLIRMRTD